MESTPSNNLDPATTASKEPGGASNVVSGWFTKADLKDAFFATIFKQDDSAMLFLAWAAYAPMTYLIFGATREMASCLVLIPFTIAITFFFNLLRYQFSSNWRWFGRSLRAGPIEHQISFTTAGLNLVFAGEPYQFPWSYFFQVTSNKKSLVLTLNWGSQVIIPARLFESEADFAALRKKITERVVFASTSPLDNFPTADEELALSQSAAGPVVGAGETSWQEVRRAYWQFHWKEILLTAIMLAGCTIFVLMVMIYPHIAPNKMSRVGLLICLPIFTMMLLFPIWLRFSPTLHWYRERIAGATAQWTIDDRQLTHASAKCQMHFEWWEVARFVEKPDGLILIRTNIQAIYVPRRFFASDEDWRQVVEWARQSRQRK